MSGYDDPIRQRYDFPLMDFGATAGVTTHTLKGPDGYKGIIRDIGVEITEAFLDDTAEANVLVGLSGDTNAYAQCNITDGASVTTTFNVTNDTNAVLADIPADTQVLVTLTEGTDGSGVTGQGYPFVEIDWFSGV